MNDVRTPERIAIPEDEIELSFSTSGGPGGQHANRSATRVELRWRPASSRALSPGQRDRLTRALTHRLDGSGTLRLASARHRSQHRNRQEVVERLERLVAQALRPTARRVPTAVPAAARERRLAAKRQRAETKRLRATRDLD